MKLTRDEFERIGTEPPLELFLQGIKAEMTKEKYVRVLKNMLCKVLEDILEGDFEQRVEQLVRLGKENPAWIRDLLLNISKKLRGRTELPHDHPNYYNPSSFRNYFKPVKKLLDMNDITIPWRRIYATFPEIDNITESRGWTREEIQKMLKHARGPMDRVIVLVATSSGIRVGGFDLKWGDIEPIYKKDDQLGFANEEGSVMVCAMITIYRGTSSSYPTFITPEAYDALEDYRRSWASDVGRDPKSEDPIFKRDGPLPIKTGIKSIQKRVERLIVQAGLRDPRRKCQRRFDVPMMNGFRRFWNKACKESMSRDSPLSSLIKKEYMMGHAGLVSLDRNYFKAHTMELAEEYLHAVPNLTIDNSVRLLESNRRKSNQILKLESTQDVEIASLRDMVSELTKRIDSKF